MRIAAQRQAKAAQAAMAEAAAELARCTREKATLQVPPCLLVVGGGPRPYVSRVNLPDLRHKADGVSRRAPQIANTSRSCNGPRKLLSLAIAARQAKLVAIRTAAALDAGAAHEAEQRCAALSTALAAAELEAESCVSGGCRLQSGSIRDILGWTQRDRPAMECRTACTAANAR